MAENLDTVERRHLSIQEKIFASLRRKKNKLVKNEIKSNLKKELITYVLPIFLVIVLDTIFIWLNYDFCLFISTPNSCILSILIIYSIFLIIFGITKKSSISISTIAILLFILTIINQLKISYTGEPVLISDVAYLKFSSGLLDIIDDTLLTTVEKYVPTIIVFILIVIGIIYISIKTNIDVKDIKKRIPAIIIPVLLLILLFIPSAKMQDIYLNVFFDADDRKDYAYFVNTLEYYTRYGVVAGIYGQMLENRIFQPSNYNEGTLNSILNTVEEKSNKDLSIGAPNIIVILSESFWDISKLQEIEFEKDITPNFNNLKEEGLLFEMISPSYGGLTANVEMEILTGFNLAYYNKGYTPYLQLYDEDIYNNRPSIIKELNNNGYITKIISCTNEKFYNREEVYSNFGVDKSIFLHEVEKTHNKGYYLSDDYLADTIINELKNKEKQDKLFCMTLTIQQHMPYVIEKYNDYDISVANSSLDKEMEETVLAYAQGVFDADKQLGKVNNYIQTLDEPTIVVFFGDHLPYLKTATGRDVMSSLEYFNTGDETLDNYRKYNTQGLVIANYDLKDYSVKYISPDLLMPYVLNMTDLNLSSYYTWLGQTYDVLPSYNRFVAVDTKGNLYKINELTEQMKQQYLLREQMQYMLFMK